MPPRLEPNDTAVVIASWPTGHVDFRLARWLYEAQGIPWEWSTVHRMQPRVSAYNYGVAEALASGKTHLMFCDHDVIPVKSAGSHPSTDAFLDESEYDIACCPCRLDIDGAWADPGAWHCGMWRTTREALAKVEAPWFLEEYSDDGQTLKKCVCAYFANKARAAGLTVGRAGWAEHAVKRKG